MRARRLGFAAFVALFAVTAGACGSTEPREVPIEQTVFADTLHIDLTQFTRLPSGMYYRDLSVGTGATYARGDSVGVRYVGSFPNGMVFDRSAPSSQYNFRLGTGRVIPGWDIGLEGLKVGGKRQLVIPPELGYGSSDYHGIPGYSVLLFTVDAVGKY